MNSDLGRRVLDFLHARNVPRWGALAVEVLNGEAIVAGPVFRHLFFPCEESTKPGGLP